MKRMRKKGHFYNEHGFRVRENGERYHPAACRGHREHLNPHQLLDTPTLAVDACAEAKQAALLAVLAITTAIAAAKITDEAPEAGDDRMLTVGEAAQITGMSRDQLYRRKDLPFRIKNGPGQVRFSRNGIQCWQAARMGR
jgi:predicted DNA-binding transcriptional regulator AlpA